MDPQKSGQNVRVERMVEAGLGGMVGAVNEASVPELTSAALTMTSYLIDTILNESQSENKEHNRAELERGVWTLYEKVKSIQVN